MMPVEELRELLETHYNPDNPQDAAYIAASCILQPIWEDVVKTATQAAYDAEDDGTLHDVFGGITRAVLVLQSITASHMHKPDKKTPESILKMVTRSFIENLSVMKDQLPNVGSLKEEKAHATVH